MRHVPLLTSPRALWVLCGTTCVIASSCGARGSVAEPVAAEAEATEEVGAAEPAYLECDDMNPCLAGAQCNAGICLPRCGEGDACTEGAICVNGECTRACDTETPCAPGYSCEEGECTTDPCAHPRFWPLSIASENSPVLVHFRDEVERDEAQVALAAVEHSWDVETRVLGFEPPLPDNGACGPDERFDVFIWRTWRGGVSDVITDNPATEWDDTINYLILDPWGPYGGEALDATTAHELNHAMHAVHDWNETPIFFEMSAQFIEDLVYDDDNAWRQYLADFQYNPDWSLVFNDDYETYYMYGSALYLFYLRDAVFAPLAGEAPGTAHGAFLSEVWRASRNAPGNNEPDFVDALDALLRERAGRTFLDTVVGFARWRWYTGTRDDGRHFEEGGELGEDAMVPVWETLSADAGEGFTIPGDVMLLGTRYLAIEPRSNGRARRLRFVGDEAVDWSLQLVPGSDGADSDAVELDDGSFAVTSDGEARTLVVTALPPEGEPWDADEVDATRYGFQVIVD